MTPETWLFLCDFHYPEVDWPTWRCVLDFVAQNKVAGVVFGGDMFDNAEVSHHNRNRPRLRFNAGTLRKNTDGFRKKILDPVEKLLSRDCKKVWIDGNHDDWLGQYIDEHPELDGSLDRREALDLDRRGWTYVDCGKSFKHGKLRYMHGEVLSGSYGGGAFPAKKAAEVFAGSVLFAHFHTLQMFTRIMPHDKKQKWVGACSPIIGKVEAHYLRNRPTPFLNGFSIIEYHPGGCFNLYPVVVTGGRAVYGGVMYGRK